VLDRRRLHQCAHRAGKVLEALGAAPAHPGDGGGHQLHAEQVGHRLGQPVLGKKLIVQQVDHHRGDPRPVLHRRRDIGGKGRPHPLATPAAAAGMRPVFGDQQRLRLGQIEYLAYAVAGGCLRSQPRTAGRTGVGIVRDDGVRFGHLPQGLSFMPFLPAWQLAGRFAQAPRPRFALGLGQPVAGRRFAAVGAVQPQLAFQFGNPCQQHRVFGAKALHFLLDRCRGGSRLSSIVGKRRVLGQSHG
jgi:hypothetical protein